MWPFIRQSGRKPRESPDRISLLCLLADPLDRTAVSTVCHSNGWKTSFAGAPEEALRFSRRLRPPIILLDRDWSESGWREVMAALAQSSPGACILLASQVMDGYLWNEVVRNGGYDVLAKPLRAPEISRAVRLAWCYWKSANGMPFVEK